MSCALVQNREGQYPNPDNPTFQAAAACADWKNAPGYYPIVTNSPGMDSWPIAATSFMLMHVKQERPQTGADVLEFFDWAIHNGQKMAEELDDVPLPSGLVARIEDTWKAQLEDPTGAPVWM